MMDVDEFNKRVLRDSWFRREPDPDNPGCVLLTIRIVCPKDAPSLKYPAHEWFGSKALDAVYRFAYGAVFGRHVTGRDSGDGVAQA